MTAFQSNSESELIGRIHQAPTSHVAFILINPGALTHSSVALRDALLGVRIPFIEVHISNVAAREPFRRHSYLADIAIGSIVGLGALGYELALRAAAHLSTHARKQPQYPGAPLMDIRKVKKLIELLEESGIAEIEITEGEEGVRISRFPKAGRHMMPRLRWTPDAGATAEPAAASAAPVAAPVPEAPRATP